MEISYIILVHKNPDQVNRLVNRLKDQKTYFYIHVDRTVPVEPFMAVIKEQENIHFLDDHQRKPGTWGDIGIVKGTLNAMMQILKDKRSGYCILLSGQDYPLKRHDTLNDFLQKNDGTHFLDIFKMPGKWKGLATERLNRYKISKSSKRGHFTLLSSVFNKDFYKINSLGQLNFLRKSGKNREILKIFQKRNFPSYLEAYGGSAYWALPTDTLQHILHFVERHPDYLNYHDYTLCVDEIFFHSIIMHFQQQKGFKIEPSLTYANWEPKEGPKPATFIASDFEELQEASRNKFFARKFDLEKDRKILELIDQYILQD